MKRLLQQCREKVASLLEVLVLTACGLALDLNEAQAIESIQRSIPNEIPLFWTQRWAARKVKTQDDFAGGLVDVLPTWSRRANSRKPQRIAGQYESWLNDEVEHGA